MKINQNKITLCGKIKRAAALGAVILGLLSSTAVSYAEDGFWKQDENGWYVEFQDGSYAKQMWLSDGKDWYAFDEKGYMITGWWWIDGKWYYFQPTGEMHTGWLQVDGSWYYMEPSGAMKTGWQELEGSWYYLSSSGAMASDTWVDGYYLGSSGAWIEGIEQDLPDSITDTVNQLRAKYPDGTYWNHVGLEGDMDYSNMVTNIPCNHALYGISYCNSYILGNVKGFQCDGFARKISDEVFGSTADKTDYAYSFDKVKPGDYLRYSLTKDSFISNGHSVFVIDKTEDSLIVVEANYNGSCMIHWDGVLKREYLDSVYAECFTRY